MFTGIIKRLCFVTICLSRQALTSVFELAVSFIFITARIATNEMVPYYLNKFTDMVETHINPLSRARSFKPHSKAIGHTSSLQHVFFLVLVNNSYLVHAALSQAGFTIPVMLVCLA